MQPRTQDLIYHNPAHVPALGLHLSPVGVSRGVAASLIRIPDWLSRYDRNERLNHAVREALIAPSSLQ